MNLKVGWNRRSFLAAVGAIWGGLFAPAELNATVILGKKRKSSTPPVDGSPIGPIPTGLGSTGDIYAELGIRPLVNINGTLTVIGGSVMKPEVMELIRREAPSTVFRSTNLRSQPVSSSRKCANPPPATPVW